VKKIHAFRTEEAASIERGAIELDLSAQAQKLGRNPERATVRIPSSFNYLILKLHAFRDRMDDDAVDYGRHHALDVFTTVTDMSKEDWANAQEHFADEAGAAHVKEAAAIRRTHFADRNGKGVLRLRENQAYRTNRETYDGYLDDFIRDLDELFATG
jgi:hypothetical protein